MHANILMAFGDAHRLETNDCKQTGMYYLVYILASYLILFMYKLLLADQFVRNIKLTHWLPTYDIFVL